MSFENYIKFELDHKLDFKMQRTFFINILDGSFYWIVGQGKLISDRVDMLHDYNEAMNSFTKEYKENYFWYYCYGNIGKNGNTLVELTAEPLRCFTACTIKLGEHKYDCDKEELFKAEDFRWHLEKLLEITNPYAIKRIWQEDDLFGLEAVKHASDFVVEGEVVYSWSWHKDVVEERTTCYKGKIFEVLEIILANGLAYGAEFDDFHFELMTERSFPQEIVIRTKYGKFIVVLERSCLIRIKPYYFLQDISDAGEKQPIAL